MPNGKPGDHPATDIVVHGMSVFNAAVDELIREAHRQRLLGPIAQEWLWSRSWDWKEVQRTGGEAERTGFLSSMESALQWELERRTDLSE